MKTAIYDFAVSPYSFDFASFLVCARAAGCERVVIVPGKRMVKMPSGDLIEFQKCTPMEQDQRLSSIILSLCPEAIVCKSREDAQRYMDDVVYPREYTLQKPTHGHMLANAMKAGKFPQLCANDALVAHIKERFPVRYALINIRESRIRPERNSNLSEWLKVAHWLREQGIEPIFVPDSDNTQMDCNPFIVSKTAAISASYRLALMAGAMVSLGISHGPMVMAMYSPYPFLMCRLLDERFWEVSSPYWQQMGVQLGAQLPWFTERQRFLWSAENAVFIIRELKRMFHVKREEMAA